MIVPYPTPSITKDKRYYYTGNLYATLSPLHTIFFLLFGIRAKKAFLDANRDKDRGNTASQELSSLYNITRLCCGIHHLWIDSPPSKRRFLHKQMHIRNRKTRTRKMGTATRTSSKYSMRHGNGAMPSQNRLECTMHSKPV